MEAARTYQHVPPVLQEYGDLTRVALCRYFRPRHPQRHLYSLAAEYPERGGRMLRPSLCIATARVFGASLQDALCPAVAVELLHNAFLVHDDVEDESEERRGQPTLNASYGVPTAVNVGDALLLMGLKSLMDNRPVLGPNRTMQLMEEVERMARESIEGQAIELGWRIDNTIRLGEHDYFAMVLKKTCWYTAITPMRLGALVAGRSLHELDRFIPFGFFLGAAFQIQDDLLNLVNFDGRYGKETAGDIREGKRTLMLSSLLQRCNDDERGRLVSFLGRPREQRSNADVSWVRQRMDDYNCLSDARRVAHGLAGAARHEWHVLFDELPDSRDKRFIEALPIWVLERC